MSLLTDSEFLAFLQIDEECLILLHIVMSELEMSKGLNLAKYTNYNPEQKAMSTCHLKVL